MKDKLRNRIAPRVAEPLIASALVLTVALPAFAGKGGNGKGGDSGVPLVAAPVEYRVTWFDSPDPSRSVKLVDVNAAGVAVGWLAPSEDLRGFMADADGNTWDLTDYFSDALQAHQGWRIGLATSINAAGQVACLLLPDPYEYNPPMIVAIGDIYADPPTLAAVAQFPEGVIDDYEDVRDINELGDVLLELEWTPDEPSLHLYPYPGTGNPELVAMPAEGKVGAIYDARLNAARQVVYSARVTTTSKAIRGNKVHTTETRCVYKWEPDGALRNLGAFSYDTSGGKSGVPNDRIGLNESGDAYATVGSLPSHWSSGTGLWEPIAPFGRLDAVSKAPSGEEAIIRSSDTQIVFQQGYGVFPVSVTEGLNGPEDSQRWDSQSYDFGWPIFDGISRPGPAGFGYICGWVHRFLSDGSHQFTRFILTPIPVTP